MDADDAASFEQFVRQRAAALPRSAALLVGDVQLGEDLVQEVLARLSRRWGTVRTVDNVDAYVHRALINTATSWRRRRSWHEIPTGSLPERGHEPAGYDDTVLRALRRLPPRQRAVVVARHYLDCTEQQTADLLGCSIGTVKSQHSRAVAKLRPLLAELSERT